MADKMASKAQSGVKRTDFYITEDVEPHAARARDIVAKYPEVKSLFGPEPLTKYIVAGTVLLQVLMTQVARHLNWWQFLVVAYVVGATANHSLFLAIHELSHGLGATTLLGNRMISFMANLGIGVPYCVNFKPYHMAHHKNLGADGVDTDIPTRMEAFVLTDCSTFYADHCLRKAVFLFGQILAYAGRPILVKPDMAIFDKWNALLWLVMICFDSAIAATAGWQGVFYLILSTFLAGSIHPTAGHFIAEHYVVDGVEETYSYYGPLNRLAYNVGYHNEHHDFPNVAWSKLPVLRKMAAEFYDPLPQCDSWPGLLIKFIFDDNLGPYARVVRLSKKSM